MGSPGVWSGSPSLAYQWQRCDAAGSGCVNTGSGPGDTGLSYVVAAGDVGSTLRLVVTARNSAGSSSAASPVGSVVVAAPVRPVNTTAPSVAGSWVVGETVTGSPGVWSGSPSPSLAYEWQRCDAAGLGLREHREHGA